MSERVELARLMHTWPNLDEWPPDGCAACLRLSDTLLRSGYRKLGLGEVVVPRESLMFVVDGFEAELNEFAYSEDQIIAERASIELLRRAMLAAREREVHCWEPGPEAADGCSTTCMLLDGHDGPHDWIRDDRIRVSFAPEGTKP